MRPGPRLVAAAALVGLAVGCGDKKPGEVEKLPTQPARGFVKYKGAPVKDASVSFQSLDGKVSANGKSDGVGSFTLSTYGQSDGLPAGKYKVTVAVSGAKEI
ncbi:carboxypeptidase regulatory-like domain-containing protein, partial [bacterium]|nr:carboxypeptidase regulatory-like domain-containing protein [bacterium]